MALSGSFSSTAAGTVVALNGGSATVSSSFSGPSGIVLRLNEAELWSAQVPVLWSIGNAYRSHARVALVGVVMFGVSACRGLWRAVVSGNCTVAASDTTFASLSVRAGASLTWDSGSSAARVTVSSLVVDAPAIVQSAAASLGVLLTATSSCTLTLSASANSPLSISK